MITNNAITWAQFQLRGGWRNILPVSGAYAVIIGVLIVVSMRIDPTAASQALAGWTMGIFALQIATLVLFGSAAINRTARREFTSRMIESHRLMPLPPVDAVLGYLVGSQSQVLAIAVVNLALGSFTTALSGLGVGLEDWLLANAILGCFALCGWLVILLLALISRAGFTFIAIFLTVCVIGHQGIPGMFPGLTLLFTPVTGNTLFAMLTPVAPPPPAYLIPLAAQAFLAAVCFLAATRKYTREDIPAFSPALGLLVLFIWAYVSLVGITDWDTYRPRALDAEELGDSVAVVTAVLVAMFLAIVPVASAAWSHVLWHRHQRLRDPAPMKRPAPGLPLVIAASALVVLIPAVVSREDGVSTLGLVCIGFSCVAFLVGVDYLLRLCYTIETSPTWLVLLRIFLTWSVPLILDLVRVSLTNLSHLDHPFSAITGASPLGTLILAWQQSDWHIHMVPGVVVQFLLAAAMFGPLPHPPPAFALSPATPRTTVVTRSPSRTRTSSCPFASVSSVPATSPTSTPATCPRAATSSSSASATPTPIARPQPRNATTPSPSPTTTP